MNPFPKTRLARLLVSFVAIALLAVVPVVISSGSNRISERAVPEGNQGRTFEVILQQGVEGYEGCADTHIVGAERSSNFCTEERLKIRSLDAMSALLRFELPSTIPPNATIRNAKLHLYPLSQSNSLPLELLCHMVLRPWEACQATWISATDTVPWDKAGCNRTEHDRTDWASDRVQVDTVRKWYSLDVTSLVQTWIADLSTNHGVVLKSFSPWSTMYIFASSDYGAAVSQRPKLQIVYEIPADTPTPSVTPSSTPTPTQTPSPTPTETPTVRPAPIPLSLLYKCLPSEVINNGGFEYGQFGCWQRGGTLPQTLVQQLHNSESPYSGSYCARLGDPVECIGHSRGSAWMYYTIVVPANSSAPTLSFRYRIITNDLLERAAFHVEIRDQNNTVIDQVLMDGQNSGAETPTCYTDPYPEWREFTYDLSQYKGLVIRLWFENWNEVDGGQGIWTYVDDVAVTSTGTS